ncbi:MAG: SPOR domain-containing protein [Bacteroidota bacterium]
MKTKYFAILSLTLLFSIKVAVSQDTLAVKDPVVEANNKMLETYASFFGKTIGEKVPENNTNTFVDPDADYIIEDNFIVQLGAFKKPNSNKLDKMRLYGTVFTEAKGNLTVYKLGFFQTQEKADELKAIAENEGFKGAFVNSIKVRKPKPKVEVPPPATKIDSLDQKIDSLQQKPKFDTPEITAYFKEAIKEDLVTIKNDFAETGRHRITKIIRLLKVPLNKVEKQRLAADPDLFYPEQSTLGKVYRYRSVASIPFKSSFAKIRDVGPVFEANVVDLGYSKDGYEKSLQDELMTAIEDLKAMMQTNDDKGLNVNEIFDKALYLETLINKL